MQRKNNLLLFARNSASTATAKRQAHKKLLSPRLSAPASSDKGKVLDSIIGPPLSSERITFNRDLTHDAATMEIYRNPVATSDEHFHEAASLLRYMEIGGRSPYTRETFTSAIFLRPLKNDLDSRFGNHRNRHADYNIEPVMKAIQNWIMLYNDKDDPIDLKTQHLYLPDDSEDEPAPAPEVHDAVVAANPAGLFASGNIKSGLQTFVGFEAIGLALVALMYLYEYDKLSNKELSEMLKAIYILATVIGILSGLIVALPEYQPARGPMR